MPRTKVSEKTASKKGRESSKAEKTTKRSKKEAKEEPVPRKHRKEKVNFKKYVGDILSQVSDTNRKSDRAVKQANLLAISVANRIIDKAVALFKTSKRETLSANDIRSAIIMTLPRELGKEAVERGDEAVDSYYASLTKKGKKGEKMRMAQRTGLIIPPRRARRLLDQRVPNVRKMKEVDIYLAAAIQTVLEDVLALASEQRKKPNQNLTERHMNLAVREDPELNKLFKRTLLGGGVSPTALKR